MVYCNKCGSENQDGSAYCWKCGERLKMVEGKPSSTGTDSIRTEPVPESVGKESIGSGMSGSSVKNKKKRTGAVCAIAVVLMLVIAGTAYYVSNQNDEPPPERFTMTPGTYSYESLFTLNNDETICYFADVSIELTTESIEMGEMKEYVSDSKYWNSGWEYHVTQAHDQYLGTPEKTNLDESEQDVQDIMKESFDFLDNWIPMPVCVKFVNEDGETAYGYKFINNMDSIYVSTEGIIYEMYHYVDGIPNDHYDFYLEGWKRELKFAPTYY